MNSRWRRSLEVANLTFAVGGVSNRSRNGLAACVWFVRGALDCVRGQSAPIEFRNSRVGLPEVMVPLEMDGQPSWVEYHKAASGRSG